MKKKAKKILALLLTMATLMALLAGCGSGTSAPKDGSGSNEGSSTEATESGGKDSLVVSLNGNIVTLCPMESRLSQDVVMANTVMASFLDFDTNWQVVPNIGESWEISDDGLVYTFKIKDGVKFHSGDTVTAEDVKFSMERAMVAVNNATTWGVYCDHPEIVSDNEVAMYLKKPYVPFLHVLAKTLFIHNRSYYDEYMSNGGTEAEYLMNPDGCGPYTLVKYEDGVGIELLAFPDYFKGEVPITHWYGKIITDNNARALAIESGDIDLVETHTTVPDSNIPLLREVDGLVVEDTDFETCMSLFFNTQIKPFDNVLVRKALAYATDYEWIIDVVCNGQARMCPCAYVCEKTTGFSDSKDIVHYNYDVEKAKSLLAEAGYPNGEGIPVIVATITEQRKSLIEVLQQCWGELGLEIEINVCESTSVWDEVAAGKFTIGVTTNNCMSDATMYDNYFGTENLGTGNKTWYINEELIGMMADAAVEQDPDARQELFDKIWAHVTENSPSLWLYLKPYNMIYKEGLHVSGTCPTNSVIQWDQLYWE